ncbi:hypothetical protein [Streptomyces roseolilacinus]|uniref:hypothetical protein n=1 Tax=Streptomyces roseolilacinus TaxID=66904 RepID=UPI0016763B79|nr:hypothetical protein [Streptomyces roseolilacinus]
MSSAGSPVVQRVGGESRPGDQRERPLISQAGTDRAAAARSSSLLIEAWPRPRPADVRREFAAV